MFAMEHCDDEHCWPQHRRYIFPKAIPFSAAASPTSPINTSISCKQIKDTNKAMNRLSKFDWAKYRGNTLEEVFRALVRTPEGMMKDSAASGVQTPSSDLPNYSPILDVSFYMDAIELGESIQYHRHGLRFG
jgi:alpha-galactosidase